MLPRGYMLLLSILAFVFFAKAQSTQTIYVSSPTSFTVMQFDNANVMYAIENQTPYLCLSIEIPPFDLEQSHDHLWFQDGPMVSRDFTGQTWATTTLTATTSYPSFRYTSDESFTGASFTIYIAPTDDCTGGSSGGGGSSSGGSTGTPSGLAMEKISSQQLRLSWSGSSSFGYVVYRDGMYLSFTTDMTYDIWYPMVCSPMSFQVAARTDNMNSEGPKSSPLSYTMGGAVSAYGLSSQYYDIGSNPAVISINGYGFDTAYASQPNPRCQFRTMDMNFQGVITAATVASTSSLLCAAPSETVTELINQYVYVSISECAGDSFGSMTYSVQFRIVPVVTSITPRFYGNDPLQFTITGSHFGLSSMSTTSCSINGNYMMSQVTSADSFTCSKPMTYAMIGFQYLNVMLGMQSMSSSPNMLVFALSPIVTAVTPSSVDPTASTNVAFTIQGAPWRNQFTTASIKFASTMMPMNSVEFTATVASSSEIYLSTYASSGWTPEADGSMPYQQRAQVVQLSITITSIPFSSMDMFSTQACFDSVCFPITPMFSFGGAAGGGGSTCADDRPCALTMEKVSSSQIKLRWTGTSMFGYVVYRDNMYYSSTYDNYYDFWYPMTCSPMSFQVAAKTDSMGMEGPKSDPYSYTMGGSVMASGVSSPNYDVGSSPAVITINGYNFDTAYASQPNVQCRFTTMDTNFQGTITSATVASASTLLCAAPAETVAEVSNTQVYVAISECAGPDFGSMTYSTFFRVVPRITSIFPRFYGSDSVQITVTGTHFDIQDGVYLNCQLGYSYFQGQKLTSNSLICPRQSSPTSIGFSNLMVSIGTSTTSTGPESLLFALNPIVTSASPSDVDASQATVVTFNIQGAPWISMFNSSSIKFVSSMDFMNSVQFPATVISSSEIYLSSYSYNGWTPEADGSMPNQQRAQVVALEVTVQNLPFSPSDGFFTYVCFDGVCFAVSTTFGFLSPPPSPSSWYGYFDSMSQSIAFSWTYPSTAVSGTKILRDGEVIASVDYPSSSYSYSGPFSPCANSQYAIAFFSGPLVGASSYAMGIPANALALLSSVSPTQMDGESPQNVFITSTSFGTYPGYSPPQCRYQPVDRSASEVYVSATPISDTSMECQAPPSTTMNPSFAGKLMEVSVRSCDGMSWTSPLTFQYQSDPPGCSPSVMSLGSTYITIGSSPAIITVLGSNFDNTYATSLPFCKYSGPSYDTSPISPVVVQGTIISAWQLTCPTPPLDNPNYLNGPFEVTISKCNGPTSWYSGSLSLTLSSPPIVGYITPNFFGNLESSFLVYGSRFGSEGSYMSASLGGSAYVSCERISDNSVRCIQSASMVSAGFANLILTVGTSVSTPSQDSLMFILSPSITAVSPSSIDPTASSSVVYFTVQGAPWRSSFTSSNILLLGGSDMVNVPCSIFSDSINYVYDFSWTPEADGSQPNSHRAQIIVLQCTIPPVPFTPNQLISGQVCFDSVCMNVPDIKLTIAAPMIPPSLTMANFDPMTSAVMLSWSYFAPLSSCSDCGTRIYRDSMLVGTVYYPMTSFTDSDNFAPCSMPSYTLKTFLAATESGESAPQDVQIFATPQLTSISPSSMTTTNPTYVDAYSTNWGMYSSSNPPRCSYEVDGVTKYVNAQLQDTSTMRCDAPPGYDTSFASKIVAVSVMACDGYSWTNPQPFTFIQENPNCSPPLYNIEPYSFSVGTEATVITVHGSSFDLAYATTPVYCKYYSTMDSQLSYVIPGSVVSSSIIYCPPPLVNDTRFWNMIASLTLSTCAGPTTFVSGSGQVSFVATPIISRIAPLFFGPDSLSITVKGDRLNNDFTKYHACIIDGLGTFTGTRTAMDTVVCLKYTTPSTVTAAMLALRSGDATSLPSASTLVFGLSPIVTSMQPSSFLLTQPAIIQFTVQGTPWMGMFTNVSVIFASQAGGGARLEFNATIVQSYTADVLNDISGWTPELDGTSLSPHRAQHLVLQITTSWMPYVQNEIVSICIRFDSVCFPVAVAFSFIFPPTAPGGAYGSYDSGNQKNIVGWYIPSPTTQQQSSPYGSILYRTEGPIQTATSVKQIAILPYPTNAFNDELDLGLCGQYCYYARAYSGSSISDPGTDHCIFPSGDPSIYFGRYAGNEMSALNPSYIYVNSRIGFAMNASAVPGGFVCRIEVNGVPYLLPAVAIGPRELRCNAPSDPSSYVGANVQMSIRNCDGSSYSNPVPFTFYSELAGCSPVLTSAMLDPATLREPQPVVRVTGSGFSTVYSSSRVPTCKFVSFANSTFSWTEMTSTGTVVNDNTLLCPSPSSAMWTQSPSIDYQLTVIKCAGVDRYVPPIPIALPNSPVIMSISPSFISAAEQRITVQGYQFNRYPALNVMCYAGALSMTAEVINNGSAVVCTKPDTENNIISKEQLSISFTGYATYTDPLAVLISLVPKVTSMNPAILDPRATSNKTMQFTVQGAPWSTLWTSSGIMLSSQTNMSKIVQVPAAIISSSVSFASDVASGWTPELNGTIFSQNRAQIVTLQANLPPLPFVEGEFVDVCIRFDSVCFPVTIPVLSLSPPSPPTNLSVSFNPGSSPNTVLSWSFNSSVDINLLPPSSGFYVWSATFGGLITSVPVNIFSHELYLRYCEPQAYSVSAFYDTLISSKSSILNVTITGASRIHQVTPADLNIANPQAVNVSSYDFGLYSAQTPPMCLYQAWNAGSNITTSPPTAQVMVNASVIDLNTVRCSPPPNATANPAFRVGNWIQVSVRSCDGALFSNPMQLTLYETFPVLTVSKPITSKWDDSIFVTVANIASPYDVNSIQCSFIGTNASTAPLIVSGYISQDFQQQQGNFSMSSNSSTLSVQCPKPTDMPTSPDVYFVAVSHDSIHFSKINPSARFSFVDPSSALDFNATASTGGPLLRFNVSAAPWRSDINPNTTFCAVARPEVDQVAFSPDIILSSSVLTLPASSPSYTPILGGYAAGQAKQSQIVEIQCEGPAWAYGGGPAVFAIVMHDVPFILAESFMIYDPPGVPTVFPYRNPTDSFVTIILNNARTQLFRSDVGLIADTYAGIYLDLDLNPCANVSYSAITYSGPAASNRSAPLYFYNDGPPIVELAASSASSMDRDRPVPIQLRSNQVLGNVNPPLCKYSFTDADDMLTEVVVTSTLLPSVSNFTLVCNLLPMRVPANVSTLYVDVLGCDDVSFSNQAVNISLYTEDPSCVPSMDSISPTIFTYDITTPSEITITGTNYSAIYSATRPPLCKYSTSASPAFAMPSSPAAYAEYYGPGNVTSNTAIVCPVPPVNISAFWNTQVDVSLTTCRGSIYAWNLNPLPVFLRVGPIITSVTPAFFGSLPQDFIVRGIRYNSNMNLSHVCSLGDAYLPATRLNQDTVICRKPLTSSTVDVSPLLITIDGLQSDTASSRLLSLSPVITFSNPVDINFNASSTVIDVNVVGAPWLSLFSNTSVRLNSVINPNISFEYPATIISSAVDPMTDVMFSATPYVESGNTTNSQLVILRFNLTSRWPFALTEPVAVCVRFDAVCFPVSFTFSVVTQPPPPRNFIGYFDAVNRRVSLSWAQIPINNGDSYGLEVLRDDFALDSFLYPTSSSDDARPSLQYCRTYNYSLRAFRRSIYSPTTPYVSVLIAGTPLVSYLDFLAAEMSTASPGLVRMYSSSLSWGQDSPQAPLQCRFQTVPDIAGAAVMTAFVNATTDGGQIAYCPPPFTSRNSTAIQPAFVGRQLSLSVRNCDGVSFSNELPFWIYNETANCSPNITSATVNLLSFSNTQPSVTVVGTGFNLAYSAARPPRCRFLTSNLNGVYTDLGITTGTAVSATTVVCPSLSRAMWEPLLPVVELTLSKCISDRFLPAKVTVFIPPGTIVYSISPIFYGPSPQSLSLAIFRMPNLFFTPVTASFNNVSITLPQYTPNQGITSILNFVKPQTPAAANATAAGLLSLRFGCCTLSTPISTNMVFALNPAVTQVQPATINLAVQNRLQITVQGAPWRSWFDSAGLRLSSATNASSVVTVAASILTQSVINTVNSSDPYTPEADGSVLATRRAQVFVLEVVLPPLPFAVNEQVQVCVSFDVICFPVTLVNMNVTRYTPPLTRSMQPRGIYIGRAFALDPIHLLGDSFAAFSQFFSLRMGFALFTGNNMTDFSINTNPRIWCNSTTLSSIRGQPSLACSLPLSPSIPNGPFAIGRYQVVLQVNGTTEMLLPVFPSVATTATPPLMTTAALAEGLSLQVLNPNITTRPTAIIEGPTLVSKCANISLTGRSSLGGNLRAITRYFWDSTFLAAQQVAWAQENSQFPIPAAAVPAGSSAEFTLRVEDTSGLLSLPISWTVSKALLDIPQVAIQSPAVVTAKRSVQLIFTAKSVPPSCFASDSAMVYLWTLSPPPTSGFAPSTTPSTSSSFLIPKNTLTAATDYTLTARTYNPDDPTADATHSITISIGNQPLVARISGGSRAFSVSQELVMNGSTSTDPDELATAASFSWRCFLVRDANSNTVVTAASEPCPNLASIVSAASLNPAVLRFPGHFFPESSAILMALNYSKLDGRFDSTNVTLFAQSPSLPRISIDALGPLKINPQNKLAIRGILISAGSTISGATQTVRYRWTCRQLEAANGLTSLSGSSFLLSTDSRLDIVFAPNTFTDTSIIYTVRLIATNSDGDGWSEIQVAANQPPQGGSFNVSPREGSLDTTFDLSVPNWLDVDSPLIYTFSMRKEGSTERSVVSAASSSSAVSLASLPTGTLYFSATITDSLGATSTSSEVSVIVSPPVIPAGQDATQFLSAKADSLLDNALKSGDVGSALLVVGSLSSMLNAPVATETNDNGVVVPVQEDPAVVAARAALREKLVSQVFDALSAPAAAPATADALQQRLDTLSMVTNAPKEISPRARDLVLDLVESASTSPVLDEATRKRSTDCVSNLASSVMTSTSTTSSFASSIRSTVPFGRYSLLLDESHVSTFKSKSFDASSASFSPSIAASMHRMIQFSSKTAAAQSVATANRINGILGNVLESAVGELVAGEQPVAIVSGSVAMQGTRDSGANLATRNYTTAGTNSSSFALPSSILTGTSMASNPDANVDVKQVQFAGNMYGNADNSTVKSGVTSFKLTSGGHELPIRNLPQPIRITIPLMTPINSTSAQNRTASCRYWSTAAAKWTTDGCRAVNETSPYYPGADFQGVICECDHLTSFALIEEDIMPQMNIVDPLDVTSLANLREDAISVVATLWFLYIASAYIGRKMDLRDLARRHQERKMEVQAKIAAQEEARQQRKLMAKQIRSIKLSIDISSSPDQPEHPFGSRLLQGTPSFDGSLLVDDRDKSQRSQRSHRSMSRTPRAEESGEATVGDSADQEPLVVVNAPWHIIGHVEENGDDEAGYDDDGDRSHSPINAGKYIALPMTPSAPTPAAAPRPMSAAILLEDLPNASLNLQDSFASAAMSTRRANNINKKDEYDPLARLPQANSLRFLQYLASQVPTKPGSSSARLQSRVTMAMQKQQQQQQSSNKENSKNNGQFAEFQQFTSFNMGKESQSISSISSSPTASPQKPSRFSNFFNKKSSSITPYDAASDVSVQSPQPQTAKPKKAKKKKSWLERHSAALVAWVWRPGFWRHTFAEMRKDHPWIGLVFGDPTRELTRPMRATIIFAGLMAGLMATSMFFGASNTSVSKIIVASLISTACVFPATTLAMQLFRSSHHAHKRQKALQERLARLDLLSDKEMLESRQEAVKLFEVLLPPPPPAADENIHKSNSNKYLLGSSVAPAPAGSNKERVLYMEDIKHAMASLSPAALRESVLRKAMLILDKDGDEQVDFLDFLDVYCMWKQSGLVSEQEALEDREELVDLMLDVDQAKKGYISRDDMREFMREAAPDMGEKEFLQFFESMDHEKDGCLSYAEFSAEYRRLMSDGEGAEDEQQKGPLAAFADDAKPEDEVSAAYDLMWQLAAMAERKRRILEEEELLRQEQQEEQAEEEAGTPVDSTLVPVQSKKSLVAAKIIECIKIVCGTTADTPSLRERFSGKRTSVCILTALIVLYAAFAITSVSMSIAGIAIAVLLTVLAALRFTTLKPAFLTLAISVAFTLSHLVADRSLLLELVLDISIILLPMIAFLHMRRRLFLRRVLMWFYLSAIIGCVFCVQMNELFIVGLLTSSIIPSSLLIGRMVSKRSRKFGMFSTAIASFNMSTQTTLLLALRYTLDKRRDISVAGLILVPCVILIVGGYISFRKWRRSRLNLTLKQRQARAIHPRFLYVAYGLCISTALMATYYTLLIATSFNADKSEAFFQSFYISTIQQIFLLQPIKVLGSAAYSYWGSILLASCMDFMPGGIQLLLDRLG